MLTLTTCFVMCVCIPSTCTTHGLDREAIAEYEHITNHTSRNFTTQTLALNDPNYDYDYYPQARSVLPIHSFHVIPIPYPAEPSHVAHSFSIACFSSFLRLVITPIIQKRGKDPPMQYSFLDPTGADIAALPDGSNRWGFESQVGSNLLLDATLRARLAQQNGYYWRRCSVVFRIRATSIL